ncbi:MAG: 3-hydroxyacyl-CoA dehydrogenase family protein [Candidatus Nanopelagicales bacterium]
MAEKIAVIGAGLMGSGIAQVTAASGYDVVLRDISDESLARGLKAIEGSLRKFAEKGKLTDEDVDAALGRITTTTDLHAVDQADIIVEAAFEKFEVKEEIFKELDKIAKPDAVLATNTSAIPITTIAAVTERPESVVGTHFFSPVPLMKLVELVRGYKTSDETLARAKEYSENIGKTVVVVNRDVAGFVTTRLITVLCMEAVRLVESGVISAEDLDVACKLAFGHPMGPLTTGDMTGLDIMMNASNNIYNDTQNEAWAPPELLRRMIAAGELGRKSGKGFYDYS